MKIDLRKGVTLGCVGALGFSVAPLLLGLTVAIAMGRSTGDPAGSRALGVGIVLFFAGNGVLAAFATLAALAATGRSRARGAVAGIGGIAGAVFTLLLTTSSGIATAWLLPLTSALLVLAVWAVWRLGLSRSRA